MQQMGSIPQCFDCGETFGDFAELARHIVSNKKTHKKGRKWAAKFLLVNGLSMKNQREQRERSPLTEEERETRKSLVRELSGENRISKIFCPRCKRVGNMTLPIEYAQSKEAWRLKDGTLVLSCYACSAKG